MEGGNQSTGNVVNENQENSTNNDNFQTGQMETGSEADGDISADSVVFTQGQTSESGAGLHEVCRSGQGFHDTERLENTIFHFEDTNYVIATYGEMTRQGLLLDRNQVFNCLNLRYQSSRNGDFVKHIYVDGIPVEETARGLLP